MHDRQEWQLVKVDVNLMSALSYGAISQALGGRYNGPKPVLL